MSDAICKSDTKPCECGKKMIRRFGDTVLLTNPPKYWWNWWCGGCGKVEDGGIESGIHYPTWEERWEAAQ